MKGLWRRAVVAGTALALDLVGVELPDRWRPESWSSRAFTWIGQRLSPAARGALASPLALTGSVAGAVAGRSLELWGRQLPEGLDVLSEALLLRSVLSVEATRQAAAQVSAALESDDLATARAIWAASPALADLPCEALSATEMASIATSRVAVLANTRGVAPLCYYAVAGLPGAFAYRWLSSQAIGGRLGRFGRHLGALTNAAPAWATASLMTLAAELRGADSVGAERVRHEEGGVLRSRAGAASVQTMAGALGVSLAGKGGQRINASGHAAGAADLRKAGSIAGVTVGLAGGLLLLGGLVWRVMGPRSRGA